MRPDEFSTLDRQLAMLASVVIGAGILIGVLLYVGATIRDELHAARGRGEVIREIPLRGGR